MHRPMKSQRLHRLIEVVRTQYKDERVLSSNPCCIFGPMCISTTAQGTGSLPRMYRHVIDTLRGRFNAAAGFIGVNNTRSFRAVEKLG